MFRGAVATGRQSPRPKLRPQGTPPMGGINEVMVLPCFEDQAFDRSRGGASDRQQSLGEGGVAKANV